MGAVHEVVEAPLTYEALAERYRELCGDSRFENLPGKIELASPSNSLKELREKVDAYLAAGATEAWIVYPQSRRFEFCAAGGAIQRSSYSVDLADLFD